MPIYEYTCSHCGKTHDFLQKVNDAPKTDCPDCGKTGLKKIISNTSFQLKGTGWYVTDFRNSSKKETSDSQTSQKKDKKETDKKTTANNTTKQD